VKNGEICLTRIITMGMMRWQFRKPLESWDNCTVSYCFIT
jgi:hypothetical protein